MVVVLLLLVILVLVMLVSVLVAVVGGGRGANVAGSDSKQPEKLFGSLALVVAVVATQEVQQQALYVCAVS